MGEQWRCVLSKHDEACSLRRSTHKLAERAWPAAASRAPRGLAALLLRPGHTVAAAAATSIRHSAPGTNAPSTTATQYGAPRSSEFVASGAAAKRTAPVFGAEGADEAARTDSLPVLWLPRASTATAPAGLLGAVGGLLRPPNGA